MNANNETTPCGCGPGCSTDGRRTFLTAAAATPLAIARLANAADNAVQPESLEIPADKVLSKAWVASLTARGVPEVHSGADLQRIGMPIGGMVAGQIYLGGDGTLWHWDIFNVPITTNDAHYAKPMERRSPIAQGFALCWKSEKSEGLRAFDREWQTVRFRGEYPLGKVEYSDPAVPVSVQLTAYSPFVPLAVDDSSLPVTVLEFSVHNTSSQAVDVELNGWLENRIGRLVDDDDGVEPIFETIAGADFRLVTLGARSLPRLATAKRPLIRFAEFEGDHYEGWTATGTAFGAKPSRGPATIQQLRGWRGRGLVNTWTGSDSPTGRLLSPPFRVERRYINFLVAGGNHPNRTCVNLLVDGRAVRTTTGKNDDVLRPHSWNVAQFEGRDARIEIVDLETGGWGHIDVDAIEFSDDPTERLPPLEARPDFGTMALATLPTSSFGKLGMHAIAPSAANIERVRSLVGKTGSAAALAHVATMACLQPSESRTAAFAVAWHFPNLALSGGLKTDQGRHYASRFASARAVSDHLVVNFHRLREATKRWRDNWYDSTLPWWFLDRTFLNASILATSTCHRFRDGRFYGWEGVGCCPGTCTHVWQYAQAVARLFPELERNLRERTDLNPDIGFDAKTGIVGHRGELPVGPAVDGQAGVILRVYREHLMSVDDRFLKRVWPRVRLALEWLVGRDRNGDGILEGPQHNTLDAEWFGKVPWLSSLYLAALHAASKMAHAVGENPLGERLRTIAERGADNLVGETWNERFGYFVQRPDPKNIKAVGSFDGCHIDQVFGQSWAFQLGLGRILDETKTKRALVSLWKYNFAPDVGPYRKSHKAGRWYAMPGEAGLLMTTFPFGQPPEFKDHPSAWSAMYFNECMNGFEYQVAGHMLWEGMVEEGMAIIRAVHDRYRPSRRNPYNEIECGDHYARSMASYGVFLAACGFEYDGPRGHLGFVPRLVADDFRAAFTAAEGWGAIWQRRNRNGQENGITLRYGKLVLRTLAFETAKAMERPSVRIAIGDRPLAAAVSTSGRRVEVRLHDAVTLAVDDRLVCSCA